VRRLPWKAAHALGIIADAHPRPRTGAVGGYFGALLARGGHEVWLVARGANLAALSADGLTVRLDGETLRVRPAGAVADPAEAPCADLVPRVLKSYDTPAAGRALRPVVGPDTIVLSLQNGVENEELLADALGVGPLMVALTRIGVELVAPATIAYSGRGTIVFGEPTAGRRPRAERAAAAFAAAGVPHELRRDVLVAAWEKLAWNAGFNSVPPSPDDGRRGARAAGTRDLVVAAMEEVDAVATARGIPVRRRRTAAVVEDSVRGLPDFLTSMLQDVLRGRRLEHDAINGAVVRAGARAGCRSR
jgi:2-dehydropantoate 2-reductase